MNKILIMHNIATSYYKNIVFSEFYKIHQDLKVLHLAETEKIRDWKIDLSDIVYPHEVLGVGSINDYSKRYYINKIWRALNNEKPDILYLGGYFHIAYWTALLWAKINGVKVILEMDSNKFDHLRASWKERIKQLFVKHCNVGLTYGELSKEYFVELGMPENNIVIKPNVSSRELFYLSSTLPKPDLMICDRYIIYVGRFSEEKNLLLLLNAYKNAQKKGKFQNWGLVMVGSGPQKDELKQYVENEKISNVIFSGFVDKHDLKNYYNHADLFVLPSIREPWGLVANEAMMCGLPVLISTQCGCSLDLVAYNGYTFDPYCVLELTDILIKYMNNEEDIASQSIRSLEIIEKFTPLKAAKCIEMAVQRLGDS